MSMTEQELERMEAELRQVRPAAAPEDFRQRLRAGIRNAAQRETAERGAAKTAPGLAPVGGASGNTVALAPNWWWPILRWVGPLAGAALFAIAVWHRGAPARTQPRTPVEPLRADRVQINQELVAAFDTVAPLPSGEPVRFHCRQWMDDVTFRDSKRGVEVQRRVPRVELIPVSFETY